MPPALFALIAAALAGFAARDQLVLAALARVQGARPAALLMGVACAVAATVIAGLAAQGLAGLDPLARRFVVPLALGVAGLELLLARTPREPREPTNSLAALGLVLFAHQLTDAVRLLVLAVAVAWQAPFPAVAGGCAGSVLALALGWLSPEGAQAGWAMPLRRSLGALSLIGAATGLALAH